MRQNKNEFLFKFHIDETNAKFVRFKKYIDICQTNTSV